MKNDCLHIPGRLPEYIFSFFPHIIRIINDYTRGGNMSLSKQSSNTGLYKSTFPIQKYIEDYGFAIHGKRALLLRVATAFGGEGELGLGFTRSS